MDALNESIGKKFIETITEVLNLNINKLIFYVSNV